MKNQKIKNIVLAGLFIGIGLVLPIFTGQLHRFGKMLLPMHIPVLLCGFVLGWKYGLFVGFILPVLRSVLFSMPRLYPNAVAMSFELCTYGFVVGLLFAISKRKNVKSVYISMLIAMIAGRVVWGISEVILLGIGNGGFTFEAFIAGAFIEAFVGIILQLILIPAILLSLHKAGVADIFDGK